MAKGKGKGKGETRTEGLRCDTIDGSLRIGKEHPFSDRSYEAGNHFPKHFPTLQRIGSAPESLTLGWKSS